MLKESTKQYPKEVTIPNTNHGNDFQIHETMFYAFYYAYEKDIAFKLSTENTEYGKFDDIVLIKDSGEVMAMQLKHSKNNEPLVISDFIGKNPKGKFNFGKYLISLIDAHIISYDSTIIPPHIRLKFITNQIYPSEIKNFLKEKPYHLSCEFFDNSSVYSPIFDDIHRVVSSKYSLTNFKKIIRNFLERIEFITTVNNIELAEELKIKIKEKFNTTNDTLYHTFFYEFYRWLLTLSPNNTGEYYTKDDIKFLFEKWYQKYILLERLVGLSKNELHKINQSEKLKLNKKTELDILTGQIENNKIVLVSGLPGIGKSTIIKQYLEEKN